MRVGEIDRNENRLKRERQTGREKKLEEWGWTGKPEKTSRSKSIRQIPFFMRIATFDGE